MNENKERFLELVRKAKEGTLDDFRMTKTKEYDAIYSQLENNNGPFGLVLSGITKDGKISVFLSDNMKKQYPSFFGGGISGEELVLDESELDSLLDRFYDMNNMEILNEFFKNPANTPTESYEEYKNNRIINIPKLALLNGLDYLSCDKTGKLITKGGNSYLFENGLYITLDGEDENIILAIGEESMEYNLENGQVKNQLTNNELSQFTSRFIKSMKDLPKVYESIKSGEYIKENFINLEKTRLEQKNDELTACEKELAEIDAIIEQQSKNEGIGIGE